MKKLSFTLKGFLAGTLSNKTKVEVPDLYLELITKYQDLLAESITTDSHKGGDEQIAVVLEDICSPSLPFWFRSACVWLTEENLDRGSILVPGPRFNFHATDKNDEGIDLVTNICEGGEPLLLRSTRDERLGEDWFKGFDIESDTPAAFVPLRKGDRNIGLLTIFGLQNGPLPSRQDGLFLRSLGSLIVNYISQWKFQSRSFALAEMDELFTCNSLDELWPRAASIMKRYLSAAGCMVIYRPNPEDSRMKIVSQEGFGRKIKESIYQVGVGQTGTCAETGQPLRFDSVAQHRSTFDSELLNALEKAHGHQVRSWMAIPIGDGKMNYGVIKVINRTTRPQWFTDADKQLGLSLALRLRILVEKFLHIERIESATEEAQRQSLDAHRLAEMAEIVARQRQDDLMVIMHQLQGPLSSMLGSISYLKSKLLRREVLRLLPTAVQRDIDEELSTLEDFASDSMALSYGTFTTFALEAGREAYFGVQNIDAIEELKGLARRLQKTNARSDLTFRFRRTPDFPDLRMDPMVFIGVFYSLIHNAMKYADDHSEVTLECSFERGKAALKVKSIGEPIHPSERELIFEKFARGKILTRTGRHHSGVGLGLWVARVLMREIGGDLTVELSASEPRLSVFVVHVP